MVSKKGGEAASTYRKPPADHQFKKGQSGNPSGRPKKKPATPNNPGFDGGVLDLLQDIVLSEPKRTILVREGDKAIEMSALRPLIRSLYRLAANGDAKITRQLFELVSRSEGSRVEQAQQSLEAALNYKATYTPIFDEHERLGKPPPDIYPHPDDILIDLATGKRTINGPINEELAGAQKHLSQRAHETFPRYLKVKKALNKNPRDLALQNEFRALQKLQDILEMRTVQIE